MCHNKPFVLLSGKLDTNYISLPVALNSILHGCNTADGAREGGKKSLNKLYKITNEEKCTLMVFLLLFLSV